MFNTFTATWDFYSQVELCLQNERLVSNQNFSGVSVRTWNPKKWAMILPVMSIQCNMWNKNIPHFSPIHTFQIVLPGLLFLQIQGWAKIIYTVWIFFFYQLNFQQFHAILDSNKWCCRSMVNFTLYHLKRRPLILQQLSHCHLSKILLNSDSTC